MGDRNKTRTSELDELNRLLVKSDKVVCTICGSRNVEYIRECISFMLKDQDQLGFPGVACTVERDEYE